MITEQLRMVMKEEFQIPAWRSQTLEFWHQKVSLSVESTPTSNLNWLGLHATRALPIRVLRNLRIGNLIESGKRAHLGRNPETMIFHRVHSDTGTVVFAVFTSSNAFFGACHWTRVTKVWDILDLCGNKRVGGLSQPQSPAT